MTLQTKNIEFLRKKDYKFLKEIGRGGTGRTILIHDEIISEDFVCKKYDPYYDFHKSEYYPNFISEIKILHKLYHKNIVRVFNYYLYPDNFTGYILMEYIQGESIDRYISANPQAINDIFQQVIYGFSHLEENGILHRDIRPENILVNETDVVKIIDFGFSKKVLLPENYEKSISLNWRYSTPEDFLAELYDHCTEIYFVGKLFEQIIDDNRIDCFRFHDILQKMTCRNREERIDSFLRIGTELSTKSSLMIEFSNDDKMRYRAFAQSIETIVEKIYLGATYYSDMDIILSNLVKLRNDSALETYVQNPHRIASIFINGGFWFRKNSSVRLYELDNFIDLFTKHNTNEKLTILGNLWERLNKKERASPQLTELPF